MLMHVGVFSNHRRGDLSLQLKYTVVSTWKFDFLSTNLDFLATVPERSDGSGRPYT